MNVPARIKIGDYLALVTGNRNYRLLWFGQIISEIGDWFYAVAIYNFLLERTGSARSVGAAVVLMVLPQVLIAPLAGVVSDRLRRQAVMVNADLARAVIVIGMLVASRLETIWPIYLLLLLETLMWGLFEPARSALVPNVVGGGRELVVANTLASATWSFNLAIGSALGGLATVWLGRDPVFVINAASFLVSAVLLLRMTVTEPHAEGQPRFRLRDAVDFSPILEGFRYIRSDSRLVALLLAKAGLGLLGANHIILTILGERVFPVRDSPALGMSLLMGARGLGALVGPMAGGYWAGNRPGRMRAGIAYGFLAAAAGYVALTWAPTILVAIGCVTLAHAGGSMIWVFSTTLLQSLAEDRFRGRVFSADYASLVLLISASTWVAGSAVDAGAGIRSVSLAVGLLVLLPAALWAIVALPLWRHHKDPAEPLAP